MLNRYIKNKTLKNLVEWILTLVSTLVLFLLFRTFIVIPAGVSSNSMEPTLYHGERALVFKLPYLISKPNYNHIIAFPYKEDPNQHFVKRVIGLPGDQIDYSNGQILVNGKAIEDDFSHIFINSLGNIQYPYTVPQDSYFVMGDNRNVSKDSRFSEVGSIARKTIDGRVMFRIWPLNKIGVLK